jgi:hypothetical protein
MPWGMLAIGGRDGLAGDLVGSATIGAGQRYRFIWRS